MEYRITQEELANDLLYQTLIALEKCLAAYELPLYIVGARARDIAMKLMGEDEPKRRTEDLDIAIAIEDWATFNSICDTLQSNHFKRYKETQKFFYKGENGDIDFEVDLVPFGGIAIDEKICWPPEGNPVMSVKCFQDVMKDAVTVNIHDKVNIKMAPICGQFLIKLDTWNDRNASTDKDAEDLLFILRKYFDIKLYKEDAVPPAVVDMNDDNLDTDIWGAQWLAYDISRLLTTEHLAFYSELITNEISKEEHSKLIYHFTKYYGGNSIDEPDFPYEPCRNIWKAFGEVLNKELEERRKQ